MIKFLLIVRYIIRISVFVCLLMPVLVLAYPCWALFDVIHSPDPDDWVANKLVVGFFGLAIWGK